MKSLLNKKCKKILRVNVREKYAIIISMKGKRISFFLCACLLLISTQLSALNPDKPLNRYQSKEWRVSDGLPSDTVWALAQTPEGYLWIGTPNGLVRFDGVTFKVFSTMTHPGIIDNAVHTLFANKKGELWIGTEKGSMVYQHGSFKQVPGGLEDKESAKTKKTGTIPIESVYKNKKIICSLEDREKNLWLGTKASGLLRLRDVDFRIYSTRADAPDIIISLYEDPEGAIWIGVVHKGLYMFKDNAIARFSTPNEELDNALMDYLISAVVTDRQGNFWVATDGGGLLRITSGAGDEFTGFTTDDGLVSNDVKNLFLDGGKNLWICTGDGLNLYRMDTGTFSTPVKWENIGHAGGFAFYKHKSGDIWLGTPYGILVLENKGGTISHKEIHLQGVGVTAIYRDDSSDSGETGDVLWIGTIGTGLQRFKDGTFTSCTEENGLGSNVVYQVLPDGLGYFWMSSFNGVFRVQKSQLVDFMEGRAARVDCRVFGIEDGLSSTGCNLAALRTRAGELWFSTYRGIAVVDPGEIKAKTGPSPILSVLIDQVAVNGEVTEPGGIRDGMVFYDVEEIVFYFTAPYFAAPGKIRFKYKLDGFDEEWVYHGLGKERTAVYTGLPPGDYRFNIDAGAGALRPTGASMAFSLKVNFFKRVEFLSIAAIFVLVLIIIVLILIKRSRRQKSNTNKAN